MEEAHSNTAQMGITANDDSTDFGCVDVAYNGFVVEGCPVVSPVRVGGVSLAETGHGGVSGIGLEEWC